MSFKPKEIKEVLPTSKDIQYFGLTLSIPESCNYVATDKDGTLCAYVEEPEKGNYHFLPVSTEAGDFYNICILDFEGNWEDSLLYVGDQ